MSPAATFLAFESSPQYRRLGRGALARAANTLNSTSLGTVLKAQTTLAFGTFFASASAPDDVWATTNSELSALRGSEQVTITLPDRSPACFNTLSTWDQCTASSRAS